MDSILEGFIKDPNMRLKNNCPSLGDILVYIIMSSKYKFSEILNIYMEEHLDRQVFWMLKKVPELDF
jgi:hypothetical protein